LAIVPAMPVTSAHCLFHKARAEQGRGKYFLWRAVQGGAVVRKTPPSPGREPGALAGDSSRRLAPGG
jgi:hypothetical protein